MTDKFSCPHCGQHVVIDGAPSGLAINCPNCGVNFTIAAPLAQKRARISPLVWCAALALVAAIPAAIYLMKGAGPRRPTPVNARSAEVSKVAAPSPPRGNSKNLSSGGPLLKDRPLSAWADELDVNLVDGPDMQHVREVLKEGGQGIVPDLIAMLHDPKVDSRRQGNVALALGFAGKKDGPEVEILLSALQDENVYVRYSAIYSLRRLGLDSGKLVPLFREMLNDPESAVRRSAANNLGLIGAPSAPAIPEIERLLGDSLKMTRDRAAEAIAKIKAAVAAAAAIPPSPPASGPMIKGRPLSEWVDGLDSNKPADSTQDHVQEVLSEAGQGIIPDLITMFNGLSRDMRRRGNVARALGCAGRKNGPEFDLLWKALGDDNSYVRYSAPYALRRLRVEPEKLVPKFMEMLDDPDSLVRRGAAGNLGNIGVLAVPAIPKLEKLQSDEVQRTREMAAMAIRKIRAAERVSKVEGVAPTPEISSPKVEK